MSAACSSYHQLQPEDRVTVASLRQQGLGVREIARVLARSPSTISREMRRNACEAGGYASAPAQARCRQRRLNARPLAKLHPEGLLIAAVHHFLRLRWSPQQIALTLARIHPKGHEYRDTFRFCTRASTTASMPCPWASSNAS